ncbi:MAG: hypothetical protein M1819_002877 [Sarea resinae]|nr:MAG: hypothetical protein M1819_002877 [Sarea resinae]
MSQAGRTLSPMDTPRYGNAWQQFNYEIDHLGKKQRSKRAWVVVARRAACTIWELPPIGVVENLSNPRSRYEKQQGVGSTVYAEAVQTTPGEPRQRWKLPIVANTLEYACGDELHFCHDDDHTTLHLFLDLFFVANLTTFTSLHRINDRGSLLSYIGFFSILWTTWLQIAFFDVRFTRDSIFERVCKVVELAVFLGFASVGPHFSPNVDHSNYRAFQTCSILLLISRGLLVIQYSLAAFMLSKKYKQLVKPLICHVVIFVMTAAVYLGMIFAFRYDGSEPKVYYVWYAIVAFEGLAVVGISCWWKFLGFHHTHLSERMGLLTLIIIGEGIIGTTKTINTVVGENGWDHHAFRHFFAGALTIFFLWVLYFDHHANAGFGIVSHQIWALLHYFYHIALVLVLEGEQNLGLILNVSQQTNNLYNSIKTHCLGEHLAGPQFATSLNSSLQHFSLYDTSEDAGTISVLPQVLSSLTEIQHSPGCTNVSAGITIENLDFPALENLVGNVVVALFQRNKITPPATSPRYNNLDGLVSVFQLVYIYYFIAAGTVLLCLAAFLWIVRRRDQDVYDRLAMATRVVLAVAMYALTAIAANDNAMGNYMLNAIVIATFLLALVLVVGIDYILNLVALCKALWHHGLPSPATSPSSPSSTTAKATPSQLELRRVDHRTFARDGNNDRDGGQAADIIAPPPFSELAASIPLHETAGGTERGIWIGPGARDGEHERKKGQGDAEDGVVVTAVSTGLSASSSSGASSGTSR